ncbi:hypothetical protein MNBD_GAMMA22-1742 [hydrothermal vent metagenome]|uniref:Uncharacterized protein n=1 Tax=hydrothermal vent metagenome TaxID=652676 RepID=A0A3B1AR78_9ZZZZ
MDNNNNNSTIIESVKSSKPSKLITGSNLDKETRQHVGTGGVSQGNGEYGFIPAFKDMDLGDVYLSRYSDGRVAKVHLLDGMPAHLVISKQGGQVRSLQKSVIAGFILNDVFFTRAQAAHYVSEKVSNSA